MEDLGKVVIWQLELFGQVISYNPIMLLMTWITMAAVLFLSIKGTSKLQLLPSKLQNVFELIYEFLEEITVSTLGQKDGQKYLPFILTIFVFILSANWISLIPNIIAFFGSLIALLYFVFGSSLVEMKFESLTNFEILAQEGTWFGALMQFPAIEEPTKFVNTPLAIAILVFFAVQSYGISNKGFVGYIRSFVDDPFPMKGFWILLFPINPFFYLNIIGSIANVVSHAFRLFGNIFGGGMIIVIVSSLLHHLLIPVGLYAFFTIFAGLVQAFVFTMLSVTYIQQQQ